MAKHNPKNERIKRVYLEYLENAKRCSTATTDQVIAAITLFEALTNRKDFAKFHIAQAQSFKKQQYDLTNPKTNKPYAKATIHSRHNHLKAFFFWLAGKPGYKSRISFSDCEYFNPTANDARIATAPRQKPYPTLAQIRQALNAMPHNTYWEKRNRAIFAFAILTGVRDNAIASLSLKHVDLVARKIDQDARDVRTKNRKSITTWFFPVGEDFENTVIEWVQFLQGELSFSPNDPLFPATKVALNAQHQFAPVGLTRKSWSNADAIRKIFKNTFEKVNLPYFNPHSFRNTLVQLGETICTTPEEFKAWSQNIGHEHVLTTFTSYGQAQPNRQAEIISDLAKPKESNQSISPDAYDAMLALLQANKPR